MTYDKQLEIIYNWYWGNISKLYTAWEDFLESEYYPKVEKNSEITKPRREIFMINMFIATISNEEDNGEDKLSNYPCLSTLYIFIIIEGESYIKKCKNLKYGLVGDQEFPSLLRFYFNKRKKMGHKKFESYYIDKWNDMKNPS